MAIKREKAQAPSSSSTTQTPITTNHPYRSQLSIRQHRVPAFIPYVAVSPCFVFGPWANIKWDCTTGPLPYERVLHTVCLSSLYLQKSSALRGAISFILISIIQVRTYRIDDHHISSLSAEKEDPRSTTKRERKRESFTSQQVLLLLLLSRHDRAC